MIWIKALDTDLLLAINQMNSPFWDRFFWLFTSIPIWIPLYFTIGYSVVKPNFRIGISILVIIVLTFVLTDQISSAIFKNLFERPRPSHQHELEGLIRIINNYRGGPFGFISGHAANSFGLATITALVFRNKWLTLTLIIWAFTNSYSRVYLGVHYPGDVICGGLLGIGVAFATNYFYKLMATKYSIYDKWATGNPVENSDYFKLIIFVASLTSILLLLASNIMLKFTN